MNFPNKTISRIILAISTFGLGITFVWFLFQAESLMIGNLKVKDAEIVGIDNPIVEPKPIHSINSAYLKGRSDAERDVSNGVLKIFTRGRTENDVKVEPILKAKYGVEFYNIGCFWSKEDEMHLEGYNEISEAAIEQKFGRGNVEGLEMKMKADENLAQQYWGANSVSY